jgi:hypothetical protein
VIAIAWFVTRDRSKPDASTNAMPDAHASVDADAIIDAAGVAVDAGTFDAAMPVDAGIDASVPRVKHISPPPPPPAPPPPLPPDAGDGDTRHPRDRRN